MSDLIDPREYGKLEAQVQRIIKDVDELKDEIKELKESIQAMRDLMEQSKGGWRVLVFLGGIAGTIGSVIGWFISHSKVV